MTSQFISMTSSSNFFDVDVLLLSSLVTGLSFILVSWLVIQLWQFLFYKRLTRNPKIGNTAVLALLNIWRLGQVRDTKFGTNVSNKELLDIAKCQCYSFCRFWVIKEKPTLFLQQGESKIRLGLKCLLKRLIFEVQKQQFWIFVSSII